MSPVVLALVLAGNPTSWAALDDGARAEAEVALKREPMPARLAVAAGRFLGTRYATSPLGEGEGHDPDPLIRFDAVDCVTMVETALALSVAPDDSQLVPWLSRIRYAAEPAWAGRNHIMEAQWVPQNVAKGFVKDVTKTYGGEASRHVSKVITETAWADKLGKSLALEGETRPMGEFAFDLVPLKAAVAALARAPSGLILLVVRADKPTLVTRISHLGILVQTSQGPVVRHASQTRKKVVDEPLEKFVATNAGYTSWPVEGFVVLEPTEPPPPLQSETDGPRAPGG